jgi:ABC-2 type transport system ATP-binding protein
MSNPVLKIENLKKAFSEKEVLNNISIEISEGNIVGLIGKNGAGKSTLIKCLLGLLKPDSGDCQIFSQSSWNLNSDAKQRIGYVPQRMNGFRWMRVETMLDYTGSFYQDWDGKKVRNLLKDWDLDGWAKISTLSEGERQKLSIIQAMGHNPDVYIFDEPVASLDPVARRKFIKQLIEINLNENKTMLFSTHITSDLERIAANIAILHDGTIQYQGDLADLKEKFVKIHIKSEQTLPAVLPFDDIINSEVDNHFATATLRDASETMIAEFEKNYQAIVTVEHLNLEDIFLEMNQ